MSRRLLTAFVALFALATCVSADAQLMTLGVGRGGAAAVAGTTTYDPSFVSTHGVLSNGNLTFTSNTSTPSVYSIARTAVSISTSKYFASSHIDNAVSSDFAVGIGFVNGSASANAFLGITGSNSLGYTDDGNVYVNNASLSTAQGFTLPTFATGDVIDEAVDFGAKLVWFRKNGGNWNGNASASPATGTLGISFSSMNAGPYFFACDSAFNSATNGKSTANFGGTSYTYAAPAGFANLP